MILTFAALTRLEFCRAFHQATKTKNKSYADTYDDTEKEYKRSHGGLNCFPSYDAFRKWRDKYEARLQSAGY